jgi:hypothetical protein
MVDEKLVIELPYNAKASYNAVLCGFGTLSALLISLKWDE